MLPPAEEAVVLRGPGSAGATPVVPQNVNGTGTGLYMGLQPLS